MGLIRDVEDKTLNVSTVLLVGIGDATEDEQELVIELATGMVVAALVNLRNFHPLVELRVVNFDFLCSTIDFLARAGHNDVAVLNSTA